MSWGERSCQHYCKETCIYKDNNSSFRCNVGCPCYISNGKEPDSVHTGYNSVAPKLVFPDVKNTLTSERSKELRKKRKKRK
jgi:hypothetical protein